LSSPPLYVMKFNYGKIGRVALIMGKLLRSIKLDDFTDKRYYPPVESDVEHVLRYFLCMVALDHRTSRYQPFEGVINGEFFHGADLLYRLGMKKFLSDPEFFSPKHLSKLTVDEVAEWLSITSNGKKVIIWDPDVRADLLRDIGIKLLKFYNGEVRQIISRAKNMLKGTKGPGLIDLLKVFKAYSDPVEKKAYLYVKFISRRGLFTYEDPYNAEVPVDNHLVRVALRLGIVEPPQQLLWKIQERVEFSWDEDVELRFAVRDAYKYIARIINVDPLILDDFLWLFGRHCCTKSKPVCVKGCSGKCEALGYCSSGCPFESECTYRGEHALHITEHNYQNTYYY